MTKQEMIEDIEPLIRANNEDDNVSFYQLVDMIKGTEEDGTVLWIPKSEDNRHYREYLAWVDEGNTPEPAEEKDKT